MLSKLKILKEIKYLIVLRGIFIRTRSRLPYFLKCWIPIPREYGCRNEIIPRHLDYDGLACGAGGFKMKVFKDGTFTNVLAYYDNRTGKILFRHYVTPRGESLQFGKLYW